MGGLEAFEEEKGLRLELKQWSSELQEAKRTNDTLRETSDMLQTRHREVETWAWGVAADHERRVQEIKLLCQGLRDQILAQDSQEGKERALHNSQSAAQCVLWRRACFAKER